MVARPASSRSKIDPLALAEHAEDRAVEGVGGEVVLGEVGVADDDAVAGRRVVGLDDALHVGTLAVDRRSATGLDDLARLDAAVQTLTRLGEPLTRARTRWMFGFQRRLVRRCECDTDMPHEGFLPHTSHTDAMIHRSSLEALSGRRPNATSARQASERGT